MARRVSDLTKAVKAIKEIYKHSSTKDLNQTREVLQHINGFELEVEAIDKIMAEREHRREYIKEYYNTRDVLMPGVFSKPSSFGERAMKLALDDDEENPYY